MCSTKALNAERAIDLPAWRVQPKEPSHPPPVKSIPAWRNRDDVTSGVPRAFHGPPPPTFPPPMPNAVWVPEAMPRSPYALPPEELARLARDVPLAKPSAKVQAVSCLQFTIKCFSTASKAVGFLISQSHIQAPTVTSDPPWRLAAAKAVKSGQRVSWPLFLWKYVQYISGSNIQNLKYNCFSASLYRTLKAYLQNQGWIQSSSGQSEGSSQGALWGSHPSGQKKEAEEG